MKSLDKTSIDECIVYELPRIQSSSGSITSICGKKNIPFDIARVYYLYDVPGGAIRGGHAHKELEELIVAAGGSFDVVLDDGFNRKIVNLNRPYYGLYLPRMIWREIINFSSGTTCLVLAAILYSANDYIREYDKFKELKNN